MSNFLDAKLEIGFFDARAAQEVIDAKVAVDAHGMTLVAANKTGEEIRWHGERRGQGHYLMISPKPGMEASLHRFADSTIFEGFWHNGPERGFWRLQIPAEALMAEQVTATTGLEGAIKRRPGTIHRRIRRAA